MAASSNISVPTQITDQQQGPLIKIFAALWLSIATIVLATRLLVRWPWRRLFGLDDYAATAATVRQKATLTGSVANNSTDHSSGPMDRYYQGFFPRPRFGDGAVVG